jgi:septal ring factor EnvC (AmiA/AmiB activator)
MSKQSLLVLIFFSFFTCLFSQSKNELLNQRDKLLNDIQLTNKLIKSTQKKQGTTEQSIRLLNRKIVKREKLIENYNAEIVIIEKKINDRKISIINLEGELEKQKELYAKILRYSYKNYNNYSKAVFLLASGSFNQFYSRKKYLEQLNDARKEKVLLISALDFQIRSEILKLKEDKIEVADALLNVKDETFNLNSEKNKKQNILTSLSKEETKLKEDLAVKRKIEDEINKRIEELIRAESKKNAYAKLTPEQQLVSDDFERNKGKLPWPTRQGIITEKFGEHYHPVIKGVKVRNNGIDISTMEESAVRNIFTGVVSKVFSIKGSNYTVIVRHGKYYTVYHNLKNIKVNVGDRLDTKQVIGYVGKDKINENSIVHFEIWRGLEKLNPESWISN